jgi:hypothetical protein
LSVILSAFKLGEAALIDVCLDRKPVLRQFLLGAKPLDSRAKRLFFGAGID